MDKPYVMGVDIGGTNTEFGVVDARGQIQYRGKISTAAYDTAEEYVAALAPALGELINEAGGKEKFVGIGIGAPNSNYYTGCMEFAPNVVWAKKGVIHLADMIKEATGLPCALTNDANAAAMGEMKYGAAIGMDNFIMITLGTGVGSGIVIGEKLVYGADGFAGELGHMVVRPHNGRLCGCGRCGCLETYASGPGIARTAREMLEAGWDEKENRERSLLRDISDREITAEDVSLKAAQGDELSLMVYDYTGKILGEAFANIVTFSSPQAIILFGGPSKAGKLIMDPVGKYMKQNMLQVFKNRETGDCKTKLLFSELKGAEAAILGASALAWDFNKTSV